MIIGVDASSIREGGGITHLMELLRASDPQAHGFSQIVLWGAAPTLDRLPDHPWILKRPEPLLVRSLAHRIYWQRFKLSALARRAGCGVLFIPGGSYLGDFRPVVAMHQNLLPFELKEFMRYGLSWPTLRLYLVRLMQTHSFRHADGVLFLSEHSRDTVLSEIGAVHGSVAVIPHGMNVRFLQPPRQQRPIEDYSEDQPFRILYVSIVDTYKHQWNVAEATARLRASGLPVTLEFIGPAYPPSLKRLQRTLGRVDPLRSFIKYSGSVPYAELESRYREANLFVMASSCEAFSLILSEAMASGLPIVASNRSSIPEVLGDGGILVDPENPADIQRGLGEMIRSAELRAAKADKAFRLSQNYSWNRCAKETFSFLMSPFGR